MFEKEGFVRARRLHKEEAHTGQGARSRIMEPDPQTNAVALSAQPGSLVPEDADRPADAITPTLQ